MKKTVEDQKLNLPDWSDSEPTKSLSLSEIIALCEKMLPIWNAERFKDPPPPLPDYPFTLAAPEPADKTKGKDA
jgi:hypothetical protein